MSLIGYNETKSFAFPGIKKLKNSNDHYVFSTFKDNKINSQPLSLMLSGNYYLIKNIIQNYDEIVMIGISGGGWYTTIISSLIPEINKSFSFAGTIPFVFKTKIENIGDWEQYASSIWDLYDYWDFYFLSTLDSNGNLNRYHYQIYNINDDCCFRGKEVKLMENISKNIIRNDSLEFITLKHNGHKINTDFLFEKLK